MLHPLLGEEPAEEALLVGLQHRGGHVGLVERQRAHDHDRLLALVQALDRVPERDELLLQLVEARGRERLRRSHGPIHSSKRPGVPAAQHEAVSRAVVAGEARPARDAREATALPGPAVRNDASPRVEDGVTGAEGVGPARGAHLVAVGPVEVAALGAWWPRNEAAANVAA